MGKLIFVILLIFALSFYSFSFEMTNNILIIDFSPQTTNLIYGAYNTLILPPPNSRLRLGGSYSTFKITNIKIDKSKYEFFYNLFIDADITPSTQVEVQIVDAKRNVVLYRLNLVSSQKSYFFNLYDVLPKKVDEIYFIFSSYTSSPYGGEINSVFITKEVILESSVDENEIKVYPNPVMARNGFLPKIVVNVGETSYLTVVIFDSSGNIVKTIVNNELFEKGIYTFNWDLKDDKGVYVPSGKYIAFSSFGNEKSVFTFLVIR